jgi:uncharacterized protein (DUF1501 family)
VTPTTWFNADTIEGPVVTPILPGAHARRAFLKRASLLALAGAGAPMAMNLAALGEAAAFQADDYKALVCVFLFGGNDQSSTLVPYDEPRHAMYSRVRGNLATPRAALDRTELRPLVPLPNGVRYALSPEMPELAALFDAGRLALQLNVGPLVVPLTRQQYEQGVLPRPAKLFSHNDQASIWQSEGAEGATRGWGGQIGDLALQANGQSMFTCISVTGNAVFLSGRQALQYQCSRAGAVAFEPVRGSTDIDFQFLPNPEMRAAMERLQRKPRQHVLAEEYARVLRRSLDSESRVTSALAGVTLSTAFPAGLHLADQLRMVARLIGARQALGVKRQVFMVSMEGFDVHDGMTSRQPQLLRRLSQSLSAFDAALRELGVDGRVTTFTASDFGRALSSNGDGTDHGWGGHQFVMGGAVRGRGFYGTPPPLSVTLSGAPEDQWHVGQGRLLPSTSVDQFSATLGRWFGATDDELHTVLPNLRHFGVRGGRPDYPDDLGFLRA